MSEKQYDHEDINIEFDVEWVLETIGYATVAALAAIVCMLVVLGYRYL